MAPSSNCIRPVHLLVGAPAGRPAAAALLRPPRKRCAKVGAAGQTEYGLEWLGGWLYGLRCCGATCDGMCIRQWGWGCGARMQELIVPCEHSAAHTSMVLVVCVS
jgi:hypothetical protein